MNFSIKEINDAIVLYLCLNEECATFADCNQDKIYKSLGFFRARQMIAEIIEPIVKETKCLIDWSKYPYALESACRLVNEAMHFRHPYLSEKALESIVSHFAYIYTMTKGLCKIDFSIQEINDAMILYFGLHEKFYTLPNDNNKQLYKALGFFRAREIIIEIIEPLIKEANMLINWSEYPYSLESACQLVKETMYFRHPYLSEKALKGIVNNFAFNNK